MPLSGLSPSTRVHDFGTIAPRSPRCTWVPLPQYRNSFWRGNNGRVNERLLQGSEYPDDTGEASPLLATALSGYAADEARYADVLAALGTARLLVPVVAVLGEVETGPDGLARDKSSDMATVLLRGADGRTALLAFSSAETLAAWNADSPAGAGPDAHRGAVRAPGRGGGAADRRLRPGPGGRRGGGPERTGGGMAAREGRRTGRLGGRY